MAVRLPVVLCQHPRRSGSHSEHEEAWITRLLFEERLDATLVADLSTIPWGSTDQLCLEGFKGGFLLLSWQPVDIVAQHLQRLGIAPVDLVPLQGSGRIAILPSEVETTGGASSLPMRGSQPEKRIYYMPLDLGRSVDLGIQELKSLLSSLSTPVFQLQSLAPSARVTASNPKAPLSKHPSKEESEGTSFLTQFGLTQASLPAQITALEGTASPTVEKKTDLGDSNLDDEFPNIDSLVRELDELDL